MDNISEGLTFDDILLVPDFLEECEATVATNLTKKIRLNIPILSAAMDTVTEAKMAIAIARQGGLGIIHKNMPIERQVEEVDKVKRSEHGVISDPFSLSPNHYVYEAEELMAHFRISGVPITENNKLVGIITNRDLRFETDHNKKVYEVMTSENLITAPEGTGLNEAKTILTQHKIEKLPIVDQKSNLKGLITIKDIQKAIRYPYSAKDEQGRLLVGAAIGAADYMARAEALRGAKADIIVLDAAHGHSRWVLNAIREIKNTFDDLQVIVGNVVTAKATAALIEAGADAVKVGMGSGSVCTTRVVSGAGVPQFSAIKNCYEAAKPHGIPIISDGGVRYSGDLTKALAAGASACMVGNLFAGCTESASATELYQGRKYKVYRGMGSVSAMVEGGMFFKEHESSPVPEGVEGRSLYKGDVVDMTTQLVGGLKAGMAYCGCCSIEDLQTRAEFVKVTPAATVEGHPFDIQVTKEAPNYTKVI